MKILIVSSFFPPQNSIASLRPYSWAKYWSKAGHDVTVITTSKQQQSNDLNLDCSFFNVISIPIPFLYRITQSYHHINEENSIKKASHVSVINKLLHKLKNHYTSFSKKTGCFYACRYPDFHDLWAKKAIKLLKNEKYDFVISSGWPYSVHRIGLALKKRKQVTKWIVDWRDLWTQNHLYNGIRLFNSYEQFLENKFHKNADFITTVSDPLTEIIQLSTKTPVKTIFNGYDKDDYSLIINKSRKKNKHFTIVYTGSIYRTYQNPSPFFQALHELDIEKKITPNDLIIQFAGCNADVYDLAEKYNILDYYSYIGFVCREKALQLQYDADAVLFLECENPDAKGILTGKLFEYLSLARTIWAVGISSDSTAGKLIEDTHSGICFKKDITKIKEHILTVLKQQTLQEKKMDVIAKYERRIQAEKLISLIY